MVRENGQITKQVFSESTKLPVHWSSKIPVRYNGNAITGELHRFKGITSDFNKELKRIRLKHRNAGFLLKFIKETIRNFEREKGEMIIPERLFDEIKTFCSVPPKTVLKRKIVEAYYINKCQLSLNSQVNSDLMNLFRNDVTKSCSLYP